MRVEELEISDAWVVTPQQHVDDRGVFLEWYRADVLESTIGHALDLRQANTSVSARGVLRGIHYALVPPGQAKYVTTTSGSVLDFIIDVRTGSPTFGEWTSVLLDDVDRKAVYISEGLGHAFIALSGTASVSYLVSEVYNPARELEISARDPEIGLTLPEETSAAIMSARDVAAPSLDEARRAGNLPSWDDCRRHYDSLNEGR